MFLKKLKSVENFSFLFDTTEKKLLNISKLIYKKSTKDIEGYKTTLFK